MSGQEPQLMRGTARPANIVCNIHDMSSNMSYNKRAYMRGSEVILCRHEEGGGALVSGEIV